MKQHINSEQLKELTPNQFRKLCKLIGDKYHYDCTDEQILKCLQKEYLTMYISILEKTNIGKMIELLHNVSLETHIDYDNQIKKWCVELKVMLSPPFTRDSLFIDADGINLCDVLWELIKSFVLNESEEN